MAVRYTMVDQTIKAWLTSVTSFTDLLRRPDGGASIFLAMPSASPLPALIITRVGGAPVIRADLPVQRGRFQFDCWGPDRATAANIAESLVALCDDLGARGGWNDAGRHLLTVSVTTVLWLPDPEADTPRYVVDATVTSLDE